MTSDFTPMVDNTELIELAQAPVAEPAVEEDGTAAVPQEAIATQESVTTLTPPPTYTNMPPPVLREAVSRLSNHFGSNRRQRLNAAVQPLGSAPLDRCEEILHSTVIQQVDDGVTEVNMSECAKTDLGKKLSMGYAFAFRLGSAGEFRSVGGLYGWLNNSQNEYFRSAVGMDCLKRFNARRGDDDVRMAPNPAWRELVATATLGKVFTIPGLVQQLAACELRFRVYSVDEEAPLDVRSASSEVWYVPMIYEIQRLGRQHLADPEAEIVPDFSFLKDISWRKDRMKMHDRFNG
jgi:hypothetical protein